MAVPTVDLSSAKGLSIVAAPASLPSSYSLRPGYVTGVGDQGIYGTCWAFATFGSLESCLLETSGGADHRNFSENNLAVNGGWDSPNPFALGVSNSGGGNLQLATAYLARWQGPVDDADDPYPAPGTNLHPTVRGHLQNVLWVPPASGIAATDPAWMENVKTMVHDRGGVWVAMSMDDGNAAYWNPAVNAYYYPAPADLSSVTLNHAVTLVGWDDGYAKTHFATEPPGDGAFLAKNSWGTSWGDAGYFYVSYYDAGIGRSLSGVFADAEPTSKYQAVYQYDELGDVCNIALAEEATTHRVKFANVYHADVAGSLAAVAFYSSQPQSSYKVYACSGSDKQQLALRCQGVLPETGYRTVALPSPLPIAAGSDFVVAVELTSPDRGTDDDYPALALELPLVVTAHGKSEGFFGTSSATGAPGQSSFFYETNGTWYDLSVLSGYFPTNQDTDILTEYLTPDYTKANVCLKAFMAGDTTPPTTYDNAGTGWHAAPFTLTLTPDDGTGSGMSGGQAKTEYSRDGGVSWQTGTSVPFTGWRRGGGSGAFSVQVRSTDAAGNAETPHPVAVKVDSSKPTSSATLGAAGGGQATVYIKGTDAYSGVATVRYSLDGGSWTSAAYPGGNGYGVTISGVGAHTLRYYAVDGVGNVQVGYNVSLVTITSGGATLKAAAPVEPKRRTAHGRTHRRHHPHTVRR